MSRCKYGRHVPSFLLLFLAKEPCYGSTLLAKMEKELPYNPVDSAAVYRSLKELEKSGAVTSYWDTSQPGPAKKWYKITPVGFEKLGEYRDDIEKRRKNLDFFLQTYAGLINNGEGSN